MAMTKAEKVIVEELEVSISLLRALAWPQYPSPALMTEADIRANLIEGGIKCGFHERVCRGWFANSYSQTVSYGCSNGVHHDRLGNTTSTQGMGLMLWTEADAWKVIRHELTHEFAKKLARIDQQIARAQQEPSDAS